MYTKIIRKKFLLFLSLQQIKMSGRNINFDGKKIKKSTFCKNKTINTIENIDVKIY